jgi:hypothetical protein
MRPPHLRFQNADIVAAFKQQSDAEKVLLQLHQAGFRSKDLGYFVWHPLAGLKNLLDRTHAFEGAVAGAILGAVFGVWVLPVVSGRLVSGLSVHGFLELTLLCVVCASLIFGFIGWAIGARIHESAAEVPVIDPEAGPFILTVSAGEDREWVWSVVRSHHGYEARHEVTVPAHQI